MSIALIIVIVLLFGLLLIGAPVIMAIGTAAMSYFFIKPEMLSNLMMYPHRLFTGMDSFIYLCIPLFMLSGELMGKTGLMDKIVDFCRLFVGRLRGGILSGAFTATEASAIAVIYVLVLDLIMSRKLTRQQLWEALKTTASSSATIYLIIGFTSIIGWILAVENVPAMIQGWVYSSNISPYLLFFLFNVFILFNGMWISDSAQMVLYAPLFTPIFVSMGCSAIHVGVVMVVNVMIGMITPPFGMALYTVAGVTGRNLKKIVKASLPFTAACIAVLFAITYFPDLVIWLPRMMGLQI